MAFQPSAGHLMVRLHNRTPKYPFNFGDCVDVIEHVDLIDRLTMAEDRYV
jgi:hypothetical protein